MKLFSERLVWAMDRLPGRGRKITQTELAAACGTSQSVVNDWRSGASKSPNVKYLFRAARCLGVQAEWLASGEGDWQETFGTVTVQSQATTLDLEILSESLKWLDFVEATSGKLGYAERGKQLGAIYSKLAADGGKASPQTAQELLESARDRPTREGEQNGKRSTAGRKR